MKIIMMSAFLVLPLFLSTANASSLTCTAPGLSYWAQSSDGGASISPESMLVLRHEILIDQKRFDPVTAPAVTFLLKGKAQRLTRDQRNQNDYVTRIFKQTAEVTRVNSNDETVVLFEGSVICESVSYVGVPRPMPRPGPF